MSDNTKIERTIRDVADVIVTVSDYLKERLDNGSDIYESAWLDPLMIAHGELLELVDG